MRNSHATTWLEGHEASYDLGQSPVFGKRRSVPWLRRPGAVPGLLPVRFPSPLAQPRAPGPRPPAGPRPAYVTPDSARRRQRTASFSPATRGLTARGPHWRTTRASFAGDDDRHARGTVTHTIPVVGHRPVRIVLGFWERKWEQRPAASCGQAGRRRDRGCSGSCRSTLRRRMDSSAHSPCVIIRAMYARV